MGPAALLVGFFAGVGFAGFAADGHAEGDAGGGPFFADDVFEVAQVAVGEFGGAVGEHDEVRHGEGGVFGAVDLGGVEEFEAEFGVAERAGAVFDGLMEEAVEGAGADAVAGAFADAFDGFEELADELFFAGGDGDQGGVVEEEEFAAHAFLQLFQAVLLFGAGVVEVELVHDEEAGFALLEDELGDFAVLHFGAVGAVDDEEAEVGAFDALEGLLDAVDFDGGVDFGAAADAGGVDELVVAAVEGGVDVEGVAGGAGDFADDGALLAEDGVDEGGFAGVRAADDGDFEGADVFAGFGFGGLAFGFGFEVEAVADGFDEEVDADAVDGADFGLLGEAEFAEFASAKAAAGGVGLIADEDDGFAGFAEDAGEFGVDGGDAFGDVDDEEEEVGDFEGDGGFGLDLGGEDVVGIGADAAGVHDFEDGGAAAAFGGDAVAGDAGHVMDDGDVFSGEAVEEGGFPDVGTSDDGDGFRHSGEGSGF